MYRTVYSLIVELDIPGRLSELVIPLTPNGQSPTVFAGYPKQRVIDLRVGDQFTHRPTGKRYRIKTIAAYRDTVSAEVESLRRDGYTFEVKR